MRVVLLALLIVVSGWGQVRGGGFRNYGSPSGFGNILYPGVGTAPSIGFQSPSFAHRLGQNVAGLPVFPNVQRHPGGHGRGMPVVVPYPVYVGGGYGYGYGYNDPTPNVTFVQPMPQPAPQIIINHHYTPESARPVVRDYTQTPLPETGMRTYEAPGRPPMERKSIDDEKPTIYLVALKDGTIYPAVAYWADGNTLNYVTLQGSHNRVTFDLVDRELSLRINAERSVEFNLPALK